MCVAYTAKLNGKVVVLKTPLPNTNHVEIAANDLEVPITLLFLVVPVKYSSHAVSSS